MENQRKSNNGVSRRQFLGTTLGAAAAASMVPFVKSCARRSIAYPAGTGQKSNFNGVQVGAITYSFRGLNSVEDTLQACIDSGVGSIELMSSGIEQWAGAPELVRGYRPPWGGYAEGEEPPSDEEIAEINAQAEASQEALRDWRLNDPPMDRFVELAQMYNDAGVNIHMVKFSPGNWEEEEIDYAFQVAQAMGAKGVSNEIGEEACQNMGPVAERYDMFAVMHNHMQYADPEFSADPFLDISPSVMLNFDQGHYYGSTGRNPVDFIREYHDRIYSLHLKDKTGPDTEPANENQVWGQGETPLEEVLRLVRDEEYPIYCDIELEYSVPAWSNSVKEVNRCLEYAQRALMLPPV